MRKAAVILCALAVSILTAAGCTPARKPPRGAVTHYSTDGKITAFPPDPEAAGSLTVDFLFEANDDAARRAKMLYQELYPNVEVTVIEHQTPPLEGDAWKSWIIDYLKSFQAEIMAGRGPDIFFVSSDINDIPKAMKAGAFADLTPYFQEDPNWNPSDFNETIFNSGQYQGKQYLVPLDYFFPLILTTEEIIKETGFRMENCTDYFSTGDEIVRTLSRYGETAPDFHPETAFDRLHTPYYWPNWSGILQMDYTDCTVRMPEEDVRHVYEQLQELRPYLYNQRDSFQPLSSTPLFQRMLDREVLFSEFLQSIRADCSRQIPALIGAGETPVLLPYRNVDGGITALSVNYVAVNQNCADMEQAYRFVKLLLSEEFALTPKGTPEGDWLLRNIPVSRDALAALMEKWKRLPNSGTPQEGWVFVQGMPYPGGGFPEELAEQFLRYTGEIDRVCLETPADVFVREDLLPCLYGEARFEACYQAVLEKAQIYLSE